MKLKKGETRTVYFREDSEFIERDTVLNMVRGKTLTEGRAMVEQLEKASKTTWFDKFGRERAGSCCNTVLEVSIKPADIELKQKELLDDLKRGLEAISKDDCSLDDIRRALRAQINYSELMDMIND